METVVRITLVYLFVLVGLRVLGKREFSQLSPIELVTLLLIPEIMSQSIIREDFSLTNAFVAVSTLFVLVFVNSLLVHLSRGFETVVESKPTVLVHHGQLVMEHLNKERMTPDEIFGEMRKVGLERLEQVRWAVLEGDGKVAIVPEEGVERTQRADDELVT